MVTYGDKVDLLAARRPLTMPNAISRVEYSPLKGQLSGIERIVFRVPPPGAAEFLEKATSGDRPLGATFAAARLRINSTVKGRMAPP